MYHNIACTIFNNSTWGENVDWRRRHHHPGCIYCSPTDIGVSTTSAGSTMFVLEMNNDENRIMGVGKIICGAASAASAEAGNRLAQRKFNVYESRSYNRYKFIGRERVDRQTHIDSNPKLAAIFKRLDWMLFRTSRHAKRGRGIQRIPKWITEVAERRCNYTLSRFFDQLFRSVL
jgi:hypothetical protein